MTTAAGISITAAHDGPILRLTVAGVADQAAAPVLRAALHNAVTAPSATACVVDVGPLRLLAAAGITVLLQARALAASRSHPFTVINTHGIVARVLHITETYDLLTRPRNGL